MAIQTAVSQSLVNGVWQPGVYAVEAKGVEGLNKVFADINTINKSVGSIEAAVTNVILRTSRETSVNTTATETVATKETPFSSTTQRGTDVTGTNKTVTSGKLQDTVTDVYTVVYGLFLQ